MLKCPENPNHSLFLGEYSQTVEWLVDSNGLLLRIDDVPEPEDLIPVSPYLCWYCASNGKIVEAINTES